MLKIKNDSKCQYVKAFTLIELSIVLVIISLVVGGIVGGKALIHSAELSKLVTQYNGYKTAFRTFELQYDALPGDIIDANQYWPSCVDIGNNDCNGDGNGLIHDTMAGKEGYRAWQHLSLSEILAGNFVGDIPGGTFDSIETLHALFPHGVLDSLFSVYGVGVANGKTLRNHIQISGVNQIGVSSLMGGGVLTPKDAKNIDSKIDDGHADGGSVRAEAGLDGFFRLPGCVAGGAAFPQVGDYTLSTETKDCRLFLDL